MCSGWEPVDGAYQSTGQVARREGVWRVYGCGVTRIGLSFLCRGSYLTLGSTVEENAFVAGYLRLILSR